MAFLRGIGDSDPVRPETAGSHEEERRIDRSGHLGTGTLACARCDAPVVLAGGAAAVTDWLSCPFCSHRGRVRDFLSLGQPTRPARVAVRVRAPFAGRARFAGISTTRTCGLDPSG